MGEIVHGEMGTVGKCLGYEYSSLFVCGQPFLTQEAKYEPLRKVNVEIDMSKTCENHIEKFYYKKQRKWYSMRFLCRTLKWGKLKAF